MRFIRRKVRLRDLWNPSNGMDSRSVVGSYEKRLYRARFHAERAWQPECVPQACNVLYRKGLCDSATL